MGNEVEYTSWAYVLLPMKYSPYVFPFCNVTTYYDLEYLQKRACFQQVSKKYIITLITAYEYIFLSCDDW